LLKISQASLCATILILKNFFRKLLERCQNSITVLEDEIKRLKDSDSERLRDEYSRLVEGLRVAQERRDNSMVLANPVLPDHVLQEAVPGSIRKGEHFVAFMKRLVEYLKTRLRVAHVVQESPAGFLADIARKVLLAYVLFVRSLSPPKPAGLK
jgi:DNA excision repair protein ERCC-2